MNGTRIGPQDIATPVGAGGRGEVYRATDTMLGRDVAIKTLPNEVAADPDRLARFQREAQLLAAVPSPWTRRLTSRCRWPKASRRPATAGSSTGI